MGRPRKDGVDFFSLDTGTFRDDKVKLLRAEFGAKGMYLLIYLLCEIYEKKGYYMQWDSDKCYLVSDGAGCACSPEFVSEFVRGCVARSFFDERVFNVFGVLTSESIQRRYLCAVRKRPNIEIIEDYFLLDVTSKKDVPEGSLANCTFRKISDGKTEVSPSETTEKAEKMPQRKGQESNILSISLSNAHACAREKETGEGTDKTGSAGAISDVPEIPRADLPEDDLYGVSSMGDDEADEIPVDEFGDPIDPEDLTDPEEIRKYRETVALIAARRRQRDIGGIFMSDNQFGKLAELLSPEEIDHYMGVVRDCVKKGRKPKSAFNFILKMAIQDRKVDSAAVKKLTKNG